MGAVDFERHMTIAAFSAFVSIREFLGKHSAPDLATAVKSVRLINADAAGLDYSAGEHLHNMLDDSLRWTEGARGLRLVIGELVAISQPWWVRLIPYGRDKVRAALGVDQVQCFREAGLFDPVPDEEVLAWWDEASATVRGSRDAERMIRAREAERLSFEYECRRVRDLGIELQPEWVSLNDNTLGYDILSYDWSAGEIVSRLIETKSTTSQSIFISRNEWENADGAESRYVFHVWRMPDRAMAEYPVAAIRPSIPLDQGSGAWQDVLLTL